MAIRIIKEVNRTEGRTPASGVTIIGGDVLILDSTNDGTVRPYNDGGFTAVPYGLAIEQTVLPPIAPTSGQTAGEGFDFTNFARGGKVSAFINGGEFELFDNGSGLPYVGGDTYVVNSPVFTTNTGKITIDGSSGKPQVGSVVEFDTATNATRLRIKSSI